MNENMKKRKLWPKILVIMAVVAVVLLASAALLMTTLSLEIQISGDPHITLDCGAEYRDAGAEAVLQSSLFGKLDTFAVEVQYPKNLSKPGNYNVQYRAEFWWLTAVNERNISVVDREAPKIELITVPGSFTVPGEKYQEEGFTATDNCDGDITDKVQRNVTETEVIYTVTDSSGNTTEVRRTIIYGDTVAPVISLKGESQITLPVGSRFTDPGFTATDNSVGDITAQVAVSGSVNIYSAGTYTLTYTVTDPYGNTASVTRTVVLEAIKQPDIVNPGDKVVYLTFDDGPCAYTKKLLDILAKYNVKVTFFVCDKGTNNNKIMQRIVAEGHAIGVHTQCHDYDVIYASEEAYLKDFYAMREIIKAQTGVETNIFRFPGGTSNGVSKFNPGIMTRLSKLMTDMGYRYFDWNVSSGDAGGTKTAEGVYQNVINGIKNKNVSVVLQHDIKPYSVEAVEKIIIWGLQNGYTFLPLDASSPVCQHKPNN